MAIVTPRPIPKTFELPNRLFTLHSRENNIFTLGLGSRPSVVGFRTLANAYFVAEKLELNYKQNNEWLEMGAPLYLPAFTPEAYELSMIDVKEWELEDLKYMCTSNILDLISVEQIKTDDDTCLLYGNMYNFTASVEFYQSRFNQILSLEQ